MEDLRKKDIIEKLRLLKHKLEMEYAYRRNKGEDVELIKKDLEVIYKKELSKILWVKFWNLEEINIVF